MHTRVAVGTNEDPKIGLTDDGRGGLEVSKKGGRKWAGGKESKIRMDGQRCVLGSNAG